MKILLRNTIFALLLFASASVGQTTTTTVRGSITAASGGSHLAGSCDFRPAAPFVSGDGYQVWGIPNNVSFTGGVLTVPLVPTDSSVSGSPYYEQRCRIPLQTAAGVNCEGSATLLATGTCVVGPVSLGPYYLRVPTSVTTVDLSAVMVPTRPAASIMVPWQQITFAGLGNGCFSILNGAATTFACGQLTSGLTWTHQVAYTWTQM